MLYAALVMQAHPSGTISLLALQSSHPGDTMNSLPTDHRHEHADVFHRAWSSGALSRPRWQPGEEVEGWVTAEITPYPRPLASLEAPYEAQFVLAVVEYPSGLASQWGSLHWRAVDVVLRSDGAWPVVVDGDERAAGHARTAESRRRAGAPGTVMGLGAGRPRPYVVQPPLPQALRTGARPAAVALTRLFRQRMLTRRRTQQAQTEPLRRRRKISCMRKALPPSLASSAACIVPSSPI